MKNTNRLIFISSPYSAVYEKIENLFRGHSKNVINSIAWKNIHLIATIGIDYIKELNHIPISPIYAFENIYNERECPAEIISRLDSDTSKIQEYLNHERELALKACSTLLERCDGMLFIHTPYTPNSKGMAMEYELAKKLNKEILELKLNEKLEIIK